MDNRPRARKKNVTSGGTGVFRRGQGLGTGSVGGGQSALGGGSGRRSSGNRGGGGLPLIAIIIILLLGGGGGLGSLLGGGGSSSGGGSIQATEPQADPVPTHAAQSQTAGSLTGGSSSYGSSPFGGSSYGGSQASSYSGADIFSQLMGGSSAGSSTGWLDGENNTGRLNTDVSPEAREKYTKIKGSGRDKTTIMVYMCGTDLESKSAMATNDMVEMQNATIGDNINLLVYTGGCTAWKNNTMSTRTNEIYKIGGGKLQRVQPDAGNVSMTKPSTLSGFIKWCAKEYPADRYDLIFWDHGGGSLSGYGYDQKFPKSGSMSLSGISEALKEGGVKFDFVGFDACLMATAETALMLNDYADYLIGSEETEPGIGWYYTNWLTNYSNDPSMPTLEIGKQICDDFVAKCASTCRGQKTTLSVTDLSELSQTLPDDFRAFSKGTSELIKNKEYKTVSNARVNAREFAQSTRIDQIDLVNFAKNVGTEEGKKLAETLLSAVKYNKTSSNMTNAYGLSIYFPYQRTSTVDKAAQTYDAIGLDDSYTDCIRDFASLEVSGQVSSGGTQSPYGSLFGGSSYSGGQSAEMIGSLLEAFMGSSMSGISGLSASNTDFLLGRSLSTEETAEYISENSFDASKLSWKTNGAGQPAVSLSEEQWGLVHTVDLNMFYDDGSGYIDLGLDNLYTFDDDGSLVADTDGTWLSINSQPVAYYHMDTVDDGTNYTITGRVPARLNGEDVNLILIFDQDNEDGYIAGAQPVYAAEETETTARGLIELKKGDVLDFVADYYSYDGEFQDSYFIGNEMIVGDEMMISNTDVGGRIKELYRFTDIYNQNYWTDPVPGL